MCGIAGVFHRDPRKPVDSQLLVNMAAIQHHRGPDNFGYINPDNLGLGMSHARLSINDLDEERARQPIATDNHQHILVHNGEFYDYKRLRAELTLTGARFATKNRN